MYAKDYFKISLAAFLALSAPELEPPPEPLPFLLFPLLLLEPFFELPSAFSANFFASSFSPPRSSAHAPSLVVADLLLSFASYPTQAPPNLPA